MEQYIEFPVENVVLRGVLHRPEKRAGSGSAPAIVLCHGFCGTKVGLHRIFVKAARTFAQAGYAVLRFDFSGCGDSDGEHGETTLERQVREARRAVETVAALPGIDPKRITLLGLSQGGCVAALAAPSLPFLEQVVLWAPVARPWNDITGLLGRELTERALRNGWADFGGYAIGRTYLESLRKPDPVEAIRHVPVPLLVIHGTGDQEITWENTCKYHVSRKVAGLGHLTNTILVTGADHTFSSHEWEQLVFSQTLSWLQGESRREHGDCEAPRCAVVL
ncbi:alpha/beta fold hydrolase [Heliobacterium gestii]|uniref:Alpha/beta fold hydrolase n=1 Tax=Heliomicrobium gestii TaxID=2699 RepID=A0A845LIJ9_HELGE|nr:alpha/beta fold hydrolase [Heliomicrobium gestii]MBM7865981.1 alpha-beta hydrolase superfamily lysophospholipase [Heliomicrobium gestii]MZP42686.1 alpha/beta fold hydrolase [Heliomicrobium gestii]